MTIFDLGNVNTVPPRVSCSKVSNCKLCFLAASEAAIPAGPAPMITRSR